MRDFHYTVRGSWPFPMDMLRRDGSSPLSEDDEEKIRILSSDYASDKSDIRDRATVNLVIRAAGRARPNAERWLSFGWKVEDPQADAEADRIARRAKVYASMMEKLTPEEREALDWFRPPFHG